MPKLIKRKPPAEPRPVQCPVCPVQCPVCDRMQTDRGQRATCEYCGMSPIPSYSYPKDCAFYPHPRRKTIDEQWADMQARYRKEQGR